MTEEPKVFWHEIPFSINADVFVLLNGNELELKRFWTYQQFDKENNFADRPCIYIELEEKE